MFIKMLLSHQNKIIFIVSLKTLKCYHINRLTVHGNRQCYLNWSCCKMISANSSNHFLELLHRIKTGIFGKHYTSNIQDIYLYCCSLFLTVKNHTKNVLINRKCCSIANVSNHIRNDILWNVEEVVKYNFCIKELDIISVTCVR